MSASEYLNLTLRKLLKCDYSTSDGIVNVMIDICYAVAYLNDLSFKRHRHYASAVIENAVSHFICKVESSSSGGIFYEVDRSEALLIVNESAWMDLVQDLFTHMTEWSMPKIVPKRDGFCKIFIVGKYPCDRARYLGYLQGMSQACSVVIAFRCEKDLCLMDESSECL